MANPENKQIPYESTQKDIRDAIESVATAIGGITHPDAEDIVYDNSVSGLSATDVQNALDEIVSDIPTVNNGTLTIQQNGTSIGSFSANTASNVTANIKTPTADKKTATSEFSTADGGLLSKCLIDLVPVQSGSGDPSPDNVRPISGHTEVDLYNVGKNKFDKLLMSDVNLNVSVKSKTIQLKPNTIYTASSNVQFLNSRTDFFFMLPSDSPDSAVNGVWENHSITLTTGSDGNVKVAYRNPDYPNTTTPTLDAFLSHEFQIEEGSTATSYEPYLGHLYQVQIGSTVYGGYVDLVSGVMVADRATVTYNGTESWTDSSSLPDYYQFQRSASDSVNLIGAICDKFKSIGLADRGTQNGLVTYIDKGVRFALLPSFGVTTTAQWQTWLSNNPTTICYKLAAPITIQLTPQQIETLAGQNNLSTPLSGQSIETNGVEYKELFTFADVKEYVDKKIPDAPTTDGTYTLQAVVLGGVPTYSWV